MNHRWVDASIASGRRADESKFAVEDELEAAAAAAAFRRRPEAEVAMGRDVPWDSCFLLGTRVYLFELEAKGEEARRATRIIRHAGAATTSNPSKATQRRGERRRPAGESQASERAPRPGGVHQLAGRV